MKQEQRVGSEIIGMECRSSRSASFRRAMGVLLLASLFGAGCSGFNRAWKEAGVTPSPTRSLEGRWLGTWTSEENGHKGRLRCIVELSPDGTYEAWFGANYQKIFSYSYKVPLTVEIKGGTAKFKGAVDLGSFAGGIYFYEGEANGAEFHSTFRSPSDHGTFEMRRPPPDR